MCLVFYLTSDYLLKPILNHLRRSFLTKARTIVAG